MNTLITINSILERHSTPLSRKRINDLINKKENKLGKFYLYLSANIAESKVARLLGYQHEKEKNYLMLKKRLRDFLEDTLKFCDLTKSGVPETSYYDKLNNAVQMARVMRKEQNFILTHYYSQKAIKMAEETGHMDIWLECLKMDMLYYHNIGNIEMLNETDQKIQKLTTDINLLNRIMSFILREEMELRKPKPYDSNAWEEKTIYLENEIRQFKSEAVQCKSKHVNLAVITTELFVALRADESERWRRLAEEGFQLINGNLNENSTFTTFIYVFRGVSLIFAEKYKELDEHLSFLSPMCMRYPLFEFNFSTLKISALLQQHLYDEAYQLFARSLKIKIPLKLQNQEVETRQDHIMLLFLFLSACQKVSLKADDIRVFKLVLKKDTLPWQQDLRTYKIILLHVCLNEIATAKIASAKRSLKKLRTNIEAYPFGPKIWRIQYLIAAIDQYLTWFPNKKVIEKNTKYFIDELQNNNNTKSADEFFSYVEMWNLLMEKLK